MGGKVLWIIQPDYILMPLGHKDCNACWGGRYLKLYNGKHLNSRSSRSPGWAVISVSHNKAAQSFNYSCCCLDCVLARLCLFNKEYDLQEKTSRESRPLRFSQRQEDDSMCSFQIICRTRRRETQNISRHVNKEVVTNLGNILYILFISEVEMRRWIPVSCLCVKSKAVVRVCLA